MAAPNIVNVTTLTAKSSGTQLSTTNATTIISNAASSNKVYKINSVIAANVDGVNSADITLALHNVASGGGTGVKIASTIAVPADTSVVLLDKASGIYLEENTSLVATASAINDIDIVASWEEIS
jgi:hypothetical protein